jgi:hypothetical protein
MADVLSFPKPAAAPASGSWEAFKPMIRQVMEIAGCHKHMIDWILADIARRWPNMFPDLPPLLLEVDTAKVGALRDFVQALGNAHIASVLLLELELYQAIHRTPNGGTRIALAG